jgi:hypothetical protein
MRKPFSTSIEEDIQDTFKEMCKKQGVSMNDALESLMKMVNDGTFKFRKITSIDVIGEEKK